MAEQRNQIQITAAGGHWRILGIASGAAYAAGFFPDDPVTAPTPATAPVWQTRASDPSVLERHCGFPLPLSAHVDLRKSASADPVSPGWPADPTPPPARSRPARHDQVLIAGRTTTYGRWLHDEPPVSWDDGTYRIDTVGVVAREPGTGRLHVAYRILHHDRVVLAHADLIVPADSRVGFDAAIRLARDRALTSRELSAAERGWLGAHHRELTARTGPPPSPYPPGTRVLVDVGDYREAATGRIVRACLDSAGRLTGYLWRPDVYDHAGHPYQDQSHRWLHSAARDVTPTLRPADPGPADLLGYGARVRAIDHPGLDTGTVLRLSPSGPEHGMICQVQPDHDPDAEPVLLDEGDVELIAGHAWPTVTRLIAARDDAGLPLEPAEALITLRELAMVSTDPVDPPTLYQVEAIPRIPDPLLDPTVDQPAARFRDPLQPPLPDFPPPAAGAHPPTM
jgi:hypothetical protein